MDFPLILTLVQIWRFDISVWIQDFPRKNSHKQAVLKSSIRYSRIHTLDNI